MSKPAAKQEKATLEEDKSTRIGFENAPKLFSKWSYDDIKVKHPPHRSETPASSTTLPQHPPKLKSSSPTPPEDTRPRSSERHSAPSLKDLLDHSSSTEETPARKLRPSELSDMPSKLSTSSPEETHSRFS